MNKWGVGLTFLLATISAMAKDIQLLNVSHDLTHELYEQYNEAFSAYWEQQAGDNVVIRQSYGGSGKQATSVINGIGADVVTLALAYDMDAVAERGRIDKGQIKRLSDNSAPHTSTIVFPAHKGNPKQIHDWNNLTKPGVSVITPNPKSSGGARWNYLAVWGYALHHNNNDQAKAQDFVWTLYKNVEVLDPGAHGSTNTFIECGIGDALITWENEALLVTNRLGKDKFEIVTPSKSTFAEPTVSMVNKVAEKKSTREVAEAYLKYLYSPEGQEIAAKSYYRPHDAEVAKKYENASPKLKLFTIDEESDGWTKAQKGHFANGDTFDQISKRRFSQDNY